MRILTFILYTFLLVSQTPQDQTAYWNSVIDQYEQLCKACLEGKSQSQIAELKKSFDMLLDKPVGKMNEKQKARFDALRTKYAGIAPEAIPQRIDTVVIVRQPVIEKVREVEHVIVVDTVKRVENVNIIKVENVFHKKDTTVVIHEYHAPATTSKNLKNAEPKIAARTAKEKKSIKRKPVSLMAAASFAFIPDFSLGGIVGLGTSKAGGYIKARSNFGDTGFDHEYPSSSQGLWTNGKESASRSVITAGPYFKLGRNFLIYSGAGFGQNGLYFQEINGSWARISDYSNKGLSFDLGCYYDWGKIRFILGATTTAFKYFDLEAGIGIVLF